MGLTCSVNIAYLNAHGISCGKNPTRRLTLSVQECVALVRGTNSKNLCLNVMYFVRGTPPALEHGPRPRGPINVDLELIERVQCNNQTLRSLHLV